MADIINRLLLDTSNFDAKLSNSKKGVSSYQSNVTQMAKTAGAGILKFAGAFGVAIGASEAFTKTINSTQTTGDAWVKMQDQMKAGVDSFFASIAMGNFDGFLSNLQNVIDKAGDLSIALDNLGTKTLFNNSEVNDLNTKYQLELNAAKARNISDKERNEHLQKARGYLVEMANLQKSLANANKETSYTALQADIAKQGFDRNVSKDVWEYLLKDSNRADIENKASSYKKTVSDYESKISNSQKFNTWTGEYVNTSETDRLKAELNKFKNSHSGKFGEMAKTFLELADDEKSAIASAIKMRATANSLNVAISQKELEIANTDAKINGSFNSQNGNVNSRNTPAVSVGSTSDLNKQISDKNKELIEATTMQARIAVQTTINELEAKKINLKIAVDKGAFADKYGDGSKASKVNSSEIIGFQYNKGSNLGELRKSAPKIKSPISKKDVDLLDKYQEDLYGISSIMWSMSGVMNEGAAAWMNWGASLLGAVAQAIPAIKQLIPALTAKAGAEAIAGSASSGPIGWISAGAAVAAIFAAFASLPSFSTGGIFEGGSTFGDMNLARVNAGEMILNGVQQANLFRLLNSSTNTPTQGGNVSFKIHGKDLVGVISNYNNQKSKVR